MLQRVRLIVWPVSTFACELADGWFRGKADKRTNPCPLVASITPCRLTVCSSFYSS